MKNTICPICDYAVSRRYVGSDVQCPNCGVSYSTSEKIDFSILPWDELSPKARKKFFEKTKRVESRLQAMLLSLVIISLILSKILGQFGMGVSSFLASAYVIYYLAQTKRYGVAFLDESGWADTDTIAKREKPVQFQIEIFFSYISIICFFVAGIYLVV